MAEVNIEQLDQVQNAELDGVLIALVNYGTHLEAVINSLKAALGGDDIQGKFGVILKSLISMYENNYKGTHAALSDTQTNLGNLINGFQLTYDEFRSFFHD